MKKYLLYIVVLLSLLLASCASPAGGSPSATSPTFTDTPAEGLGGPGPETDTPAPVVEPTQEIIHINQPDLNSQILSPVLVQGLAQPTFEQHLVVTITGADGDLLATQPTTIQADVGQGGPFSVEVSFTVGQQQPGRVSVYSTSALDGGIVHLSSSEVLLLPGGAAQINSAGADQEDVQILAPSPQAQVSGGTLQVSGYSDYYFEANLGVVICGPGGSGAPHQLCGTADNVITEGFATINSANIGQAGPFSGEISYSIGSPTPARVIVFAASARDGGLLHANSVMVDLQP